MLFPASRARAHAAFRDLSRFTAGESTPRPDLLRGISPEIRARLDLLLDALVEHPHAPTAIVVREDARDKHIADSLSGLEVEELRDAQAIADVGSGTGFPGLALAAALPAAHVDLVEGSSRKCKVARDLAAVAGIENVAAIDRRSEEWAAREGRERYDVVTARAVGSLAELCELASPLLRDEGVLVAWKGGRDRDEESAASAGSKRTAMVFGRVVPVTPFAGSRERHLHVYRKAGPTPAGLPRRPGQAHKRPLGT